MSDHYSRYLQAYTSASLGSPLKDMCQHGFGLAAQALGMHHGKKDLPPLPYEGFCMAVRVLMHDPEEALAQVRAEIERERLAKSAQA